MVLTQHVLQLCEGRIGFIGAVTAVFFIEILTALTAQPLTIGLANGVDGNF